MNDITKGKTEMTTAWTKLKTNPIALLAKAEEEMLTDMRQEMRILRPDFGVARLIDWDKTAMDTVEGRE